MLNKDTLYNIATKLLTYPLALIYALIRIIITSIIYIFYIVGILLVSLFGFLLWILSNPLSWFLELLLWFLNSLFFIIDKFFYEIMVIIMFCFLVMTVYFHPTKEIMHCDSNYLCTIEHEFLNIIKINHSLTLNPNSTMSINKHIVGGQYIYRRPNIPMCETNIYFDNDNPFIMFYDKSSARECKESNTNNFYKVEDEFKKYLQNPTNNFEISNDINSVYCYCIIILSAITFVMFWGYFRTEKRKEKIGLD